LISKKQSGSDSYHGIHDGRAWQAERQKGRKARAVEQKAAISDMQSASFTLLLENLMNRVQNPTSKTIQTRQTNSQSRSLQRHRASEASRVGR